MSFFRRRKAESDDNDLTLRPVRSVVDVQAEAQRLEERAARKRKAKVKRSRSKFFSSSRLSIGGTTIHETPPSIAVTPPAPVTEEPESESLPAPSGPVSPPTPPAPVPTSSAAGPRRRVYLNQKLPRDELGPKGDPVAQYVRNKVRTTSMCTRLRLQC